MSNLLKTKSKMQHAPELINCMKDAIIGGTTSWLDVNDDPYREVEGFKSGNKKKGEPASVPIYAPKGDSIENSAL